MARLLAMYKTPKNAEAFDAYYYGRHVPLAKTIPGLRRYEVTSGPVLTPTGPSPFHLIATLHFDFSLRHRRSLRLQRGTSGSRRFAKLRHRRC